MMLRIIQTGLVLLIVMLTAYGHAADNLDKLLLAIKGDIKAQRLSAPAGNNALEKIRLFRQQAPFDFRITPLAYQWGEAYVALANKAIASGKKKTAQSYLDKVWPVAPLTSGLEKAQAKLGDRQQNSGSKAKSQNDKAELDRQKRLAAAAAKEKALLEKKRQLRQLEARRKAEEEKRQAAVRLKKAQEKERQQRNKIARLRAAEAQKNKNSKAEPAQKKKEKTPALAARPVKKVTNNVSWEQVKESSSPVATYPLNKELIEKRNRAISGELKPVCQAIVDKDASVVLHVASKSDYRWLTVRLTLCLRRLDRSFRLRHSFDSSAEPHITLHPSRGSSLLRKSA